MKNVKVRVALTTTTIMGVISSYTWACYVAGSCVCALPGRAYGSRSLPDCNIPTSIIAEASATIWNVCAGDGPYLGRKVTTYFSPCCPPACRLYNNCTQQYESFSGSICCFQVSTYEGTGTCQ